MRVAVETPVVRSARVLQTAGIFDLTLEATSRLEWQVEMPYDAAPWNIGLIVGPSGAGKSTIARAVFGDALVESYAWPADRALVDAFPPGLSVKDVIACLSSVGLSSPPTWLRPYAVLSTGEKFRADMARALADLQAGVRARVVVDEFTSVVDRTVARIGSAAIEAAVRKGNHQIVAVSCHEDIEAWLRPDWVYRPADNSFTRRALQPRPPITLRVERARASAWRLFRHHHYLDTSLNQSAYCFIASLDDRPVAFASSLPLLHPAWPNTKREHRTVVLPDYQGVGIGNHLSAYIAAAWRALGYRYVSRTSHPSMVGHRARSPHWRMTSRPAAPRALRGNASRAKPSLNPTTSEERMAVTFEYVGPALARAEAERVIA